MNSFRMSFWVVPPIWSSGIPWFWAVTTYMASIDCAEALTVRDGVTCFKGRSLKRDSICLSDGQEMPVLPTSLTA